MVQIESILSLDVNVYNYLFRDNSITTSQNISKKERNLIDKLFIISKLQKLSDTNSNIRWFKEMIGYQVISIIYDISYYLYSDRKMYIKKLCDLNVFPITTRDTGIKNNIRLLLLNASPLLYCSLLKVKR